MKTTKGNLYSVYAFFALCAVLVSGNAIQRAWAQPPAPKFTQNETSQWREIRIHNVRPDIMAFFIDPEHQKEPLEFKIPSMVDPSHSAQDEIGAMKLGAPEFTFDGILAADNAQNILWVLSSQKTFDQTKTFIDFMDRPFSQCELELQIVKVNKEDLASFETQPIQPVLKNTSQPFSYKFSTLATNYRMTLQGTLQKLIRQGKAKIINSPRITTINQSTASISSATTTPIFVGIKNLNTPYVPFNLDSKVDYHIGQTKQLRTAFTPSINEAAKTISIDLDISADEGLTKYNGNPEDDKTIWFRNQVDPPLVAKINVDDNQVILITGLDTTMLGYDEEHSNVAIFMTVRIIHRADGG